MIYHLEMHCRDKTASIPRLAER
ncbi:hypothetical protein [Sodalis-like endosymbiont of Proechinophthirus fluctus]